MERIIKLVLLLLPMLLVAELAHAQQDPQYSMYMFNGLALNPAYAGSREATSITLLGRKQWLGIQGAPTTATFSIHGDLNEKHGIGGQLINDNIGFNNQLGVYGNYAYRIPISTGHLALGIKGGLLNYSLKWSRANPEEYEPGVIPETNQNLFLPIVGTGVYFSDDMYYLGLSVPNIIKNKLTKADVPNSETVARQAIHFFGTAGVVFKVKENFKIRPSFLVKVAEKSPVSFDFNLSCQIRESFWLGVSYRTGDAILGMLEYSFQKGDNMAFRIGYAYDFTLSELRQVSSGSHEIMLGMDIVKSKLRVITPRLF